MLNKKTSRRSLLKASGQVAGLTIAAPGIGWALSRGTDKAERPSDEEAAQCRFIEAVLKKHTANSSTTSVEEIREFAERFTQTNGVIDYQREFATISGEYRLTRLFVRSVRQGV